MNNLNVNVSLIIPFHMSIKAKSSVKINRAYSELISQICPCLHFYRNIKMSKKFLQSYCIKARQSCKWCSDIQCTSKLPIDVQIFQFVSERHRGNEWINESIYLSRIQDTRPDTKGGCNLHLQKQRNKNNKWLCLKRNYMTNQYSDPRLSIKFNNRLRFVRK